MDDRTRTDAPAARRGFFGLTVSRPIAMGVLFVTLVLVGMIAYGRIPLEFMPSGISGSRFMVVVQNDGATAQENADRVARVLEEQFETIPGIVEIRSYSDEEDASIRLKYGGEVQAELAKAEIRDRIERARPDLPDTVGRTWVWANDDGDAPVMWFAIVATERGGDVTTLIDKVVQKRLEGVDGVSRVSIWGSLDESIRIFLDEEKVYGASVDLGALIQRLAADNFAQPLGEVQEGGSQFILRSDMRFKDLAEIENYPVRPGLRLGDLGTVERVNSVRDRITRINGGYAYYGMIQKESSANVVEVGEELERVMASFETDPALGGKLTSEVFFNQAQFIRSSLDQLRSTAVTGGGLAILVLFLFLRRARLTLCVALCIPVSALLAIAFESFRGSSFNIMTMTGLTLGLGMLVDNAVVVVESVVRQRGLGKGPKEAAVLGARDVGLAVALATMTSVVVFVPLMFMGDGFLGVVLKALGMPLCASLIFSLIVALVFIPTVSARVLGDRPPVVDRVGAGLAWVAGIPARLLALVIGAVRAVFFGLLRVLHAIESVALLGLPWPVRLVAAAGIGVLAWRAMGASAADAPLADELRALALPDRTTDALSAANARIFTSAGLALLGLFVLLPPLRKQRRAAPARPERFVPPGTSIVGWAVDANRALLDWTMSHRFLAVVLSGLALFSVAIPAANTTLTAFGEDEDTSELEFWVDLEDNFTLGEASAEFKKYEDFVQRYRPEDEFGFENVVARFRSGGGEVSLRWPTRVAPKQLEQYRQRLREELPTYAGHRVRFRGEDEISDSSKQFVRFELRGPDPDVLADLSLEAARLLEGVDGLTDVTGDVEDDPDQLLLDIDSETAFSYGVNSETALQNVSWALRGVQLRRYQEEDRELPFLIEYDSKNLPDLDTVKDLRVWTGEGEVPLATFSTLRFEPAPSRIRRKNGQINTSITARVTDPTRQAELVKAGYSALGAMELPRGYSLGQDDSVAAESAAQMADLQNAMKGSVVLVFLLMGILFESLLLPFSVLTTIPFAMLGAFWTLFLSGVPMDSIGWIGIIILVGVVVNNGIVLIDKIHRLRVDDGLDRRSAVLEGAAARVRPILMTALTTVVGLLPMALGEAPTQGIDYRALATCVAGGLTVCTFFTLWVVPLAYTLLDDLGARVSWISGRAFGRRAHARKGEAAGAAA
ncbi:MAG: efflux RND transporter permease subunit [Planctomycetota bacterium]